MRKDIHRPSVINPDEYISVGFLPKVEFFNFEFVAAERAAIDAHMKEHGGHWEYPSSGSCAVCGNVLAMSHVVFWHRPTNAYIKVGEICAEKLEMSIGEGYSEFKSKLAAARKDLKNALALKAGKLKAEATLNEAGLDDAWAIYMAEPEELPRKLIYAANEWNEEPVYGLHYEESTIRDIVWKLVKYGSISEKQEEFLKKLLEKIAERPALEAKRLAEKAAEKPIPEELLEGRHTVTGEILAERYDDTPFGTMHKMLLKEDRGFKLWGTMPSALSAGKGDRVKFDAAIEVSHDDPKFGFYSRPTKAATLEAK